jgi:cyanophycinase-like exopeptidase
MPGLLVIMGSGETAPTMVKPHRAVFDRVGDRPAVLLDTPYGFQSNADDISNRAVSYFSASVGRQVGVVSWRTVPAPGLARERAMAAVNEAGWVFAGPGSPTYALRQWRETPLETAFVDVMHRDGVILLASAAALTMGSHTVPVYEIYKAGIDPYWERGLDLVEQLCGLPAVVIPHYDNAEGGHHDTRYCYLGESRLSRMEQELPPGTFVLGVDEHTAVTLDPAAGTATVAGNGTMTIRHSGRSVVHPAGSVVTFDSIASGRQSASIPAPAVPGPDGADDGPPETGTSSLRGATVEIEAGFDAAMGRRDVDGCVEAVLALEQVLLDWSADTLTSDEGDHARSRLRAMVVRLGELAAVGARDPRSTVAPLVEALLELRARARTDRDWATSDRIRDQLAGGGIEVRDTPDGARWQLIAPSEDGDGPR